MNKIVEFVDALMNLTLNDILEIKQELINRGLEIVAPTATVATVAQVVEETPKEQTEFDLTITNIEEGKLKLVKNVKALLGIDLIKAKAALDDLPYIILKSVSKKQAEEMANALATDGAKFQFTIS